MSANSDAKQILRLARERGLQTLRVNGDGGWLVCTDDGHLITRVPASGRGVNHWVANARKAIEEATA